MKSLRKTLDLLLTAREGWLFRCRGRAAYNREILHLENGTSDVGIWREIRIDASGWEFWGGGGDFGCSVILR